MTCALPMNPVEAIRELQDMAQSHPDLADRLRPISNLIVSQNAVVIDFHRTLRASRLTEHFG